MAKLGYIDGKLKYNDTTPPYSWTWNEPAFGKHKIMVKALEKSASSEIEVMIFNF